MPNDVISTFSIGAVPRDSTDPPAVQKIDLSAPPVEKTLVQLCIESLADTSTPPGVSDAAKAVHDRWLQWLAAAFNGDQGVMAQDIAGAITTLNTQNASGGYMTTCTQVLYDCLLHFGIPPKKWVSGQADAHNIAPAPWDQPYRRVVTKTTLPRVGDPIFIGGINGKEAHHAFFGDVISTDPPMVYNYAGGQATHSNYSAIPDAKRYPCHLNPNSAATNVCVGDRDIRWFTDMWAFFKDNYSDIPDQPLRPGLA
jgi:hypothetical protein